MPFMAMSLISRIDQSIPLASRRLARDTAYFPMTDVTQTPTPSPPSLANTSVFHDWWPLALSWSLMGLEMPAISAVVGNLPDAEIMLAASN